MELFLYGITIIAAGAFVSLAIPAKVKGVATALTVTAGSILCSVAAVTAILSGKTVSYVLSLKYPFESVSMYIDPLSALFILLISIGSSASAFYAIGYLAPYIKTGKGVSSNLFFLSMLVIAMFFVVTVQHALFFLVVWEIMSLSSCVLVIFEQTKKSTVESAVFYATAMHIGVVLLTAAFILVSMNSASYNFSDFIPVLAKHDKLAKTVFFLFFAGFGIKAGFVPLHSWLPRAHPAAPSHVSALMSGVMIKTGIYGILRILFLYGTPSYEMALTVIIVSVFTALFGILSAMTNRDMKKLLAYSSIENIGIIGCGIGFAMLCLHYGNTGAAFVCFTGALFHMFNHMLFKSVLFFGAGAVYQQTHTRDMEKLGGLVKKMPVTAFLVMIACAAISALPPLNGLAGEFVIFNGIMKSFSFSSPSSSVLGITTIAALGLVGSMAIITFSKFFSIPFLGLPRKNLFENVKEPSISMIAPMAVLCTGMIALGAFPDYAVSFLGKTSSFWISSSAALTPDSIIQVSYTLGIYSKAILVFFAISISILFLRFVLLHGRESVRHKTWGCGYQAASPRVQYTGHSFVQPFIFLAGAISGVRHIRELPHGIFPAAARFASKGYDTVDNMIVHPALKIMDGLFGRAVELQSGRIQIYILYGFLFIIASLVWMMIGGL